MLRQFLLLMLLLFGIHSNGFSQVDTSYQDVDEVIISSRKKKKIVFEDPKYFIVDFSITEDQTLLLMKNLGKYYLYELDEDMRFLHKLRVKMNANSLFTDCFGNTHLVTRDSTYFILNDSMGLFLTETHPRKEFLHAMEKCMGKTSDKFVFEKRSYFGEHQVYYTIDRDSSYKEVIYDINDSVNAQDNQYASTGLRDVSQSRKRGWFKERIRPQRYNPLFVDNETLYVFNHVEGRFEQMNDCGTVSSEQKINHQKKKGWKQRIYADQSSTRFYAVWMKNGVEHLIGIAMTEDEQNFSSKITKHAFPEKVIIRNGYAYYTYKPNMDANLNKLYRQKL